MTSAIRHHDVLPATAADLLQTFSRGELAPDAVARQTLQGARAWEPHIGAFTRLTEDAAMQAAAESTRRWAAGQPRALEGIPYTVKDTLSVRGFPSRKGSRATPDMACEESSPVVQHMEAAGCALVGITTTPEFGVGPLTISPLTGTTRNPWDPRRHAGGSSGGAAAAIAAGIGYAAVATDAGGSARIPAALCGVAGFKPTAGRFPTYPSNPSFPMASPGIIARNARDLALFSDTMAQPDARDPESLAPPAGPLGGQLEAFARMPGAERKKTRIAFSTTLGYAERVDPEVVQSVRDAVAHLEQHGFGVEEAAPELTSPVPTFMTLFAATQAYVVGKMTEEQQALLGPAVSGAAQRGRALRVEQYLAAQDQRRHYARTLQLFHERYAFLVTPTVATTAFDAQRTTPEGFESDPRAWTPFASLFNLTAQPVISIPCGLSRAGLPIGLQIAGPRFADAGVLALAHLFEATQPSPIGLPTLPVPDARDHA